MTGRISMKKEDLEAVAAAFMAKAASPAASDHLHDYGLQRVLAKARAAETHEEPAAMRRAYRNPALLRHALIVAMVALLVMLLSTTGVYAFSLDAQPGSTLYGTKIFFERARVTLNTSNGGDISLEMGFSERRMEELQNMLATGSPQEAKRWLREYRRNIEGAGILFEGITVQEAERLAAPFQEMLDRQAQTMQGMRRGLQSGLSEPVEGAYQVCDQERARMRQRCGQQGNEGPEQEPGGQGQQGQGNCPRTEDTSTQEETTSSTGINLLVDSSGAEGTGLPSGTPSSAPGETTTDETASPPADTSQPKSPPGDESGQDMGATGYQSEGPHKGFMP